MIFRNPWTAWRNRWDRNRRMSRMKSTSTVPTIAYIITCNPTSASQGLEHGPFTNNFRSWAKGSPLLTSAQVRVTPISPLVSVRPITWMIVGCFSVSYGRKEIQECCLAGRGSHGTVSCLMKVRKSLLSFLEFGRHKTVALIHKNHQQKGFIQ